MVVRDDNQRAHYRILYLAPDQPVFHCAQGKFPVMDISEGGFRFSLSEETRLIEKDCLEGMIHFPNKRGTVWVKGQVLRVFDCQIAVQLDLDGRIPFAKVMEEQRLFLKRARL